MAICILLLTLSFIVITNGQPAFYNPITAVPSSINLTVEDFTFDVAGQTGSAVVGNTFGYAQGATDVQVKALTGSGLQLGLFNYEPCSFLGPHVHQRATELVYITEGTINAGVVLEQGDNRLLNASVPTGSSFVFPQGLLHYTMNLGCDTAQMLSVWNSENPGAQFYPLTAFHIPLPLILGAAGASSLPVFNTGPAIPFGALPSGTCSCPPPSPAPNAAPSPTPSPTG